MSNQNNIQLPVLQTQMYYDNNYISSPNNNNYLSSPNNYLLSTYNNNDYQSQMNYLNNYNLSNELNFIGGTEPAKKETQKTETQKKETSVPDFNRDNLINTISSNPNGISDYIKKSLVEQKENSPYVKHIINVILNILNDEFGKEIIADIKKYTPAKDDQNPPDKEYLVKILRKKGFSHINIKNLLDLNTILSNNPKVSQLIKSALLLSLISLQNMKNTLPDIYSGIIMNNFNGNLQTLFTFVDNNSNNNKIIAEFKTKQFNPNDFKTLFAEKISEISKPSTPISSETEKISPSKTTPKTETPKSETKKTETPKSETKKPATPKSETKKPETPKSETAKPATPKKVQTGGKNDKYFTKYIHYKTLYLELKNNNN